MRVIRRLLIAIVIVSIILPCYHIFKIQEIIGSPQSRGRRFAASDQLLDDIKACTPNYSLVNDWGNRPLRSEWAMRFHYQQQNHSQVAVFIPTSSGMASGIHIFSNAMCHGLVDGFSLWWKADWIWADQKMCGKSKKSYPLSCYFGEKMVAKNESNALLVRHPQYRTKSVTKTPTQKRREVGDPMWCGLMQSNEDRYAIRAGFSEYLFTNVSWQLTDKASMAINQFIDTHHISDCHDITDNMITVHIRWGDKWTELRNRKTKQLTIIDYVKAVELLVSRHNIRRPIIFLSTEDIRAFRQTHGAQGSNSLVSLLIGMEAKYYVLTLASNWSRLINELRKTVRNENCGNCTDFVDLMFGHW